MFLYLNICLFLLPTVARIIFHLETLETKLNSEHHRTKILIRILPIQATKIKCNSPYKERAQRL